MIINTAVNMTTDSASKNSESLKFTKKSSTLLMNNGIKVT